MSTWDQLPAEAQAASEDALKVVESLRAGVLARERRMSLLAAKRDYYELWLPELSPSAPLVKKAQRNFDGFAKAYRREMARPVPERLLELLARLSHGADFSVGCYCEDESRCHRSVLRQLLAENGARIG